MAADDLAGMVTKLDEALERNRAGVAALDESMARGNRILRRKTLWIVITCASILLDVALTAALAIGGVALRNTAGATEASNADIRANTCNLNALLAQSTTSSPNAADLHRGLRPLFAEADDPASRAAVEYIDRSIANLEKNAKLRADFLALTQDTARRLRCPPGFVVPR